MKLKLCTLSLTYIFNVNTHKKPGKTMKGAYMAPQIDIPLVLQFNIMSHVYTSF